MSITFPEQPHEAEATHLISWAEQGVDYDLPVCDSCRTQFEDSLAEAPTLPYRVLRGSLVKHPTCMIHLMQASPA